MSKRKRNRKSTKSNKAQICVPSGNNAHGALINQAIGLGFQSQQAGDFRQAELIYNKVLATDPNNANAYHLLGILNHEKGDHDLAVLLIQKAMEIEPNVADAYCNLANAQRELGLTDEAIDNYRKAITLKPDFPQALNNLGNSLKNRGEVTKAISCLNKAIALDPKQAQYRCNLGSALLKDNRNKEAILCFRKAIDIKPDYVNAQIKLSRALQLQGHGNFKEEISLIRKAIENISTKPTPPLADARVASSLNAMENTVALITLGRAGSLFFHSLFDNHPEIWTTPGLYLKGYFEKHVWGTLSGLSGPTCNYKVLVENFCDRYEVLFDANSDKPVFGNPMGKAERVGRASGMTTMGEKKTHSLTLDQEAFKAELLKLLSLFKHVDSKVFFKLIHLAYNETLNLPQQKSALFYHFHNAELKAIVQFLGLFKKARFIQIIREPTQCLESWLYCNFPTEEETQTVNRLLDESDADLLENKANQKYISKYQESVTRVGTIFSEYGHFAFNFAPAMMVRLEDVKKNPRELMPLIADWIGVKNNENLYTPTFQGRYYWGPESKLNPRLKGFESSNVDRSAGVFFSERDQLIFKTLLYPARVRFGYQKEDPKGHSRDMKIIEPLLDEPLDFEVRLYNMLHNISAPIKELSPYQSLHRLLKSKYLEVTRKSDLPKHLTKHYEIT